MITNERQYLITRTQAEKFRAAIAKTAAEPGENPKMKLWEVAGLRAKLDDLEAELRAYETLKTAKGRKRLAGDDVGELLIQARIARGWSQRELAERLGLQMQKIQQYEATRYAGASKNRLEEVWQALGAQVEIRIQLASMPPPTAWVGEQELVGMAHRRGSRRTAEDDE